VIIGVERKTVLHGVNNNEVMMMTTATTKQVQSSSNARDLYLGGSEFESWPTLSLLKFFMVPPGKCQINALK
jgi:hypothetical protein